MRLQNLYLVFLSSVAFSVACVSRPLGAAENEKIDASKVVTPTKESLHLARLTVANELMRLHWTTWVTGKELRKIADQSAMEINHQLEVISDLEYLLPEVKARPGKRGEFEQRAVEDVRAGLAEVWREIPGGVQYVRGVHATKTCIQCHQPLGTPSGELNEGDLLGIISLKLKL